jgi:uncharacterized protein with ATP-grasp and redox domains
MKTSHRCLPCFVEQTLSVLRLTNASPQETETILRQALSLLSEIDFNATPPQTARLLHGMIRETLDHADPYADEKQRYQTLALNLYPQLAQQVNASADPLLTAVKLSIAGNSIDHGVYHAMDESRALHAIDTALHQPLVGDIDRFRQDIAAAESILFLADNAGEIVLDRLLLEQLPLAKTTVVMRGKPILNDALLEEARQAGLTGIVRVIDNGDNTPGTDLDQCRPEVVHAFNQADLIIAKGQGNYETLSDTPANLVFLLKAKCPVVAEHIGCQLNDALLLHHEFC